MTPENSETGSFVAALATTDVASGIVGVRSALGLLTAAARDVLGSGLEWTPEVVVFSGFLGRAQGFHEGVIAAIEANNPHASFTLLRAYAENAAGIGYVIDHPAQLGKFLQDPNTPDVPIGKITGHMIKRAGAFKAVYRQLSQYAHPSARSVLASSRMTFDGDQVSYSWRLTPEFKSASDKMVACGWTIEVCRATTDWLYQFAVAYLQFRPDSSAPSPD